MPGSPAVISQMVHSERNYHRLVGKETREFLRILTSGGMVFLILFSFVVATAATLRGDLAHFGLNTLWQSLQDFSVPDSLNGQLVLALVVGGLSFLGISIRASDSKQPLADTGHIDDADCAACAGLEESRERYLSGDFQVGFAVGLAAVFWVILLVILGSLGWGNVENLVQVITLIFLAFFVLVVVFQFARLSLSRSALYPGAAFDALQHFESRAERIRSWFPSGTESAFNAARRSLRIKTTLTYLSLAGIWFAVIVLGFAALPDQYDFASLYVAVLTLLFGTQFMRATYKKAKHGRPVRLSRRPLSALVAILAVTLFALYITLVVTFTAPGWLPWLIISWVGASALTALITAGLFGRGPCAFVSVSAALRFAEAARNEPDLTPALLRQKPVLRSILGTVSVRAVDGALPVAVHMEYWDELSPWRTGGESSVILPGKTLPAYFTVGTPVLFSLEEEGASWIPGCYSIHGDDALTQKMVVVLADDSAPALNPSTVPNSG